MSEITQSATEVFKFPWYFTIIPIVLFLVFGSLAVICFRKPGIRRFGFIFGGLALVLGGLVAPGMLRDKITVSPQSIALSKGFWFENIPEGFVYQDVAYVRVTNTEDIKGRKSPAWEVHFKGGNVHTIALGDLWSLNSERIKALVKSHGVKFLP